MSKVTNPSATIPQARRNGQANPAPEPGCGKWAKGTGAAEILLPVTSGIAEERTGRMVGRLGFVLVGGFFLARVR